MSNPLSKQIPDGIPVFGECPDRMTYETRPGSYAVVLNPKGNVAVLRVEDDWFLPGGGMRSNETPEECLLREVIEECGFDIRQIRKIGEAVEHVLAHTEERCYQIYAVFFTAEVGRIRNGGIEKDHVLDWLSMEDAIQKLSRPGQIWALKKFLLDMA